jgi:hypothetical protein
VKRPKRKLGSSHCWRISGKENLVPSLFCDNQGALKVAYNQEMHRKMKHIAIRYWYIREAKTNGVINTSYVSTQEQLADTFTKPLPAPRFST